MTNIEKNVVIAKFMGMDVNVSDPDGMFQGGYYIAGFTSERHGLFEDDTIWLGLSDQFSTDWNWLHKAWERFRDLEWGSDTLNSAYWEAGNWNDKIGSYILRGTISEAFEALYEGIHWYNNLTLQNKDNG